MFTDVVGIVTGSGFVASQVSKSGRPFDRLRAGYGAPGFVVEFSMSEASLGSGLGLVEVAPDGLGGFARDYGGK